MSEVIMTNVREKLSKVRENCIGMSDEIYALTDYMASVANDQLVPIGMAIFLRCVMDDIENGRNGFGSKEFPEYLKEKRNIILDQVTYFPQVIDAIADDPEFAKKFRKFCKEFFNFNPPKRVNIVINEKYPEYIKVAVNWWANTIMSPKFDNGDTSTTMGIMLLRIATSRTHEFTEDDIVIFVNTLAEEINEEIKTRGVCNLDVDYEPCEMLAFAGISIGLEPTGNFPWKTHMCITQNDVSVQYGYQADTQKIWSA